jgi:outer membrane receptor protein involved in Fe transport
MHIMRKFLLASLLIASCSGLMAQMPGGAARTGGRAMGQNMNVGHLYGKVVNSKTGKGIDGASLQLLGNRFDTATKKMVPATIKALITQSNGDFSLENLPVLGNFTLKISAIGFKPVEQKVSFGIKMPGQDGQSAGGGMEQMMNMVDKDLGNIKIEEDAANLGNVTVTTTARLFEMGVDRKIFNVDKNLTSTGQTATEVMKSIPSLSVDIDGNVTMRNAAPQLFVDGRPTTLTMDQIPADIIDKVELITNPSAKFDASGGNAGILNIVLKKNKKTGYNGGVRAGVDSRGKVNLGGDINIRQNKVNFFVSGLFNQRKSKSTTANDLKYVTVPVRLLQNGEGISDGYFGFVRGGLDYFIDNRNTLSFAGNFNRGNFKNDNSTRIDSIISGINRSYNLQEQGSDGNFRNVGTSLSFKHNFAKSGHELTGDANYNSSKNDNTNLINTQTFGAYPKSTIQRSEGGGNTKNVVIQTDYTNPITESQKIELGARAAIRDFENAVTQSFYNAATGKYDVSPSISSRYKYTDKVYAAYATYSFKIDKWSVQLGLRAESSNYDGTLIAKSVRGTDSLLNFKVDYPVSLFPSAFVTYKLSDKEDLQVNYSRRINRPGFFQLMPFIDFSDPQNISVGNAGLKPEFTNSLELSYNNNYQRGANFLVSTYFKHNTNLITRYQYYGANPDTAHYYSSADSVPFNTYINANTSYTYGIELTNRLGFTKWWDNTTNFNLFNSTINVQDAKLGTISNQRTSWFVKMTNSFKLPKNYSIQFSGEYYARTVLPQEGGRGGRGGGGGMMFGGGPTATAQGYINPRYSFDLALRKDWTWKGGTSASLTLSMGDIFRTQLYSTYSESSILVQTSERRRDPQVARLNFNYRFGKFDLTLFKRRNTKADQGGGDIIMQ